ncbi:hypothetical protein J3Q64DRAFT_1817825 [Phycomyces blakesleeanus]|uniref:Golgi apparatus membrane protein TVP38 n=2 Tax=Phycomyces blakesleeanus TaxID=4837 RepID=A0A163ELH4_PHYB8|nr:hypothetical protein PHYBLDRAFT_162386 [Phycomyces blakesleeanus NRRL 1555(-)]OAD79310.1 hypothetical protein PHYBLDRAFT_162386 [Phycomyces blakesleeanus NRRL 1555(-)]|eukprot:XP_018297350.1 hypothetical protein PHYBLDRAFT_162386 [Phycomyces blakesleeanus NRRL 1555(-)]
MITKFALVSSVLFIVYKCIFHENGDKILKWIEVTAAYLQHSSMGPPITLFAFTVLSVFPIASFTMLTIIAGSMYGFYRGALFAISGSFLGSVVCFCLARKINIEKRLKLSSKNQQIYSNLQDIIDKSGLLMSLMIRWSFLPCSVSNILLSKASNTAFGSYSLAAIIGSLKVLPKVWLGSHLTTLVKPLAPAQSHIMQYAMGSSVIVSIFVGLWVFHQARNPKYAKTQ